MFGKRFSAVTYLGFVVLQFFLYVCNADAGGTWLHHYATLAKKIADYIKVLMHWGIYWTFCLTLSILFAEILIAPQTQHALLNAEERAMFFCQATGINVFWLINDETVVAEGDETRKGNGWIFNEIVDHNVERQSENVHNLTMEIPARMEYNNTKVRCVGVIHDPAVSDPVYLIMKSESNSSYRCKSSCSLYYQGLIDESISPWYYL